MATVADPKITCPVMDSANWKEQKSGLWVWDVKTGTGTAPNPKSKKDIKAHYSMWMHDENGKPILLDSSVKRGDPIEFCLKETIAGWVEGIGGMKVGGVRHLYVPAKLAYGDKSKDETGIKKGADLIFTVELIEVL